MRALGGADDPPCGEAMGRWQREALTEGLWRYRCGPSTIACGDGPLPHRYATGRIGGLARNPSELIRQPAAEKPLVGATDVRDDRRFGEARGDAAILRAADQRSEEHTSELQSLMRISYAVFCLKQKIRNN